MLYESVVYFSSLIFVILLISFFNIVLSGFNINFSIEVLIKLIAFVTSSFVEFSFVIIVFACLIDEFKSVVDLGMYKS